MTTNLKNKFNPSGALISFAFAVLLCSITNAIEDGNSNDKLTFEEHVRPIFREHCFDCHGATGKLEGDLDLRLKRLMVKGGESGAAIEPGKPDESYLLERIVLGEMPPGDKKVPHEQIDLLRRWIVEGAATARAEPDEIGPGLGITHEERSYWAYQPIKRPVIPESGGNVEPYDNLVRTDIDALLIPDLQKAKTSFSPDADRLTLIKRCYLDLTGLPPTQTQINEFLNDERPDAYEKLIDSLLASHHYGERWGRHWLDAAGYADSEGYADRDSVRPYAYKYRDYVIKAFNDNMPFDQFILEQLAGDELVEYPYKNLKQNEIEKLIATGFLRMASDGTGDPVDDQNDARNQVMTDTIKIVSTSLLGMSVGCAQCHDHRYDPISHEDYHRMRAIFEPALNWQKWRNPTQRRISLYTDADRAKAAEIEAEATKLEKQRNENQAKFIEVELQKELMKYEQPLREKLENAYKTVGKDRTEEQNKLLKENPAVNISGGTLYQYNQAAADEIKKLDEEIAKVRQQKPVEDFLRVLTEVADDVPETKLFHRGDHRSPKQVVAPGVLSICVAGDASVTIPINATEVPTSGRRSAYARWLTSGKHPLVGRVLVNRFWMHHFGRAIVNTPGEFGKLGSAPTNQDLLDWLAVEFMESGWNLKQLHRTIMMSTVYRQTSHSDEPRRQVDPDNSLYSRFPLRRIEAEIVRDRILATSGRLDPQLFGPAIEVKPDEQGQIVIDSNRRTIYAQVRRSQPVAMLETFDLPVMETNCQVRKDSNSASQSLALMNGKFALEQSAAFAERLRKEADAIARESGFDAKRFEAPEYDLAPAWQYGFASLNNERNRIDKFTPFDFFEGISWRGGEKSPDPTIGWVMLWREGGHPGDADHAAVRRWTSNVTAVLRINGSLTRASEVSDGVRGFVESSRHGLLGEWIVENGTLKTDSKEFSVEPGDTVSFVVECRSTENSDSFQWPVVLQEVGGTRSWDSVKQFSSTTDVGPPLPVQINAAWILAYGRSATDDEMQAAIDFVQGQIQELQTGHGAPQTIEQAFAQAMTNMCQALFSSNEFLYIE